MSQANFRILYMLATRCRRSLLSQTMNFVTMRDIEKRMNKSADLQKISKSIDLVVPNLQRSKD